MAKETYKQRAIRYDWPRWSFAEGFSRFTCYAPDAEAATKLARAAGFKRASAVQIWREWPTKE